jgi:hypothetical protein
MPSTTEKIAVVPPIPRARVMSATSVNPGARSSDRNAYRASWIITLVPADA